MTKVKREYEHLQLEKEDYAVTTGERIGCMKNVDDPSSTNVFIQIVTEESDKKIYVLDNDEAILVGCSLMKKGIRGILRKIVYKLLC